MIAPNPTIQDRVVTILSQIKDEAGFAFRRFRRHVREDLIAEVVGHAWSTFSRLVGRGKDANTFPTVLEKYSVRFASVRDDKPPDDRIEWVAVEDDSLGRIRTEIESAQPLI